MPVIGREKLKSPREVPVVRSWNEVGSPKSDASTIFLSAIHILFPEYAIQYPTGIVES